MLNTLNIILLTELFYREIYSLIKFSICFYPSGEVVIGVSFLILEKSTVKNGRLLLNTIIPDAFYLV